MAKLYKKGRCPRISVEITMTIPLLRINVYFKQKPENTSNKNNIIKINFL